MKSNAIVTLSLILLTSLQAWAAKPANDEPIFWNKCQLLFQESENSLQLTEQDGKLLISTGRRKVYDDYYKDYNAKLGHRIDSAEAQRLSALLEEGLKPLPSFDVAANGTVILAETMATGEIRFTVKNSSHHSVRATFVLPGSDDVGYLREFSSNGDYIVLSDNHVSRMKLVSTRTGKVMLETQVFPGEEFYGIGARFSRGDEFLVVNRNGFIEIFDLDSDQAILKHTYSIFTSKEQLEESQWGLPIFDGVGSVFYIPDTHELLAFYDGPEPLLLKLGTQSRYNVQFFKPAKVGYQSTEDLSQFDPESARMMEELDKPRYQADIGLVSPSSNFILAVRTQGSGSDFLSTVDVFNTWTRSYVKSIPIPAQVRALAISADESLLAVASPGEEGVRIYDFTNSQVTPLSVIKFDNAEGSILSFADDGALLVGSRNYGELWRFERKSFRPSKKDRSATDL